MTFSSLISGTVPHHNKHRGRGPCNRMVDHHWAGTVGGDTRLKDPNQDVSANYILYTDGTLIGQVPEEHRPWTTGPTGDAGSITVEIQNSSGAPNWSITDAQAKMLARLKADLSKRYGWGALHRGTNVRVHQDFAATACPGPDVLRRLPSVIVEANTILGGATAAPTGTYTVKKGDTLSSIAKAHGTTWKSLQEHNHLPDPNKIKPGQVLVVTGQGPKPAPKDSVDALAQAVLRGDYGNGADRKARLGSRYAEVQARVNAMLGEKPAGTGRDIALEVYRGEWGNGSDRAARLRASGHDPVAIQAEVNRRWYS